MDYISTTSTQLDALISEQLEMCEKLIGNTLYIRLHSYALDLDVRRFLNEYKRDIVLGGTCLIYILEFADNTIYIGIPYPHSTKDA